MSIFNQGQGMQKSHSVRALSQGPNHATGGMGTDNPYGRSTTGDPYSKVSYRQKGKKVDGSLIKGTTTAAFIKKTTGSVPSKYETIVYMHADAKKKGFGSNSERF